MKNSIRLMAALLLSAAAAVASAAYHVSAASTMVKGDINRDDIVSVGDMVVLKNHLLGRYGLNDTQTIAADINGDCAVDSLDLAALQDIILGSMDKLPVGTWIGDCGGGKRYFCFDSGTVKITDPTAGTSESFLLDVTGNEAVFRAPDSGSELSAFITWTDDLSFVLKWENGSTESFRYFCAEKISPEEFLSGRWVTSGGRTFEISGLSGKLTEKDGTVSRFEYAPDGENITFRFGSTDNRTPGKIVHNDSMHFTVTWNDGTSERFTRQEIEVRDGITYVNGILIANKTYSLPSDYNPGKILSEAQAAFDTMKADAAKEGIYLSIVSGFRSYTYQGQLYSSYVNRDGKAAADTYSARAGHSEHQTGLAMDINNAGSGFNNTKEAKWLAANCVKYGFIIRYPLGKEDITGYQYESWHVRYLGRELAREVADSGLTLEEFLCIDSKYKT
ncbi:D-alanyl-D-alanine carboxypeptidase family protein [Ruminococcus sp.]|uniref:D-alanyl-D-alanine carboxypeptidase family protein n=1 Tax=Ruminococcus sp. TaxID=41978 RepID=UPI0025FEEA8A|nr:D-alanyl-D-alanine carboxypeptidase family protein [Ruminococcus sp.]